MKTTLHVQLIVTKQKGAEEENLAHQIITPTSYACQLQEGKTVGQGTVNSPEYNCYYYQRIFRGLTVQLILKEQLGLAIHSPFANTVSRPQIKPQKSLVKYLVLWKMQGFHKILVCIDFFYFPRNTDASNPLNYNMPRSPPFVSSRPASNHKTGLNDVMS